MTEGGREKGRKRGKGRRGERWKGKPDHQLEPGQPESHPTLKSEVAVQLTLVGSFLKVVKWLPS